MSGSLASGVLAWSAIAIGVVGCNRAGGEPGVDDSAALVETSSAGSIGWNVDPDGHVRASVKTADGKALGEDVGGSIVWKAADGPKTVALAQDRKSGALVAAGPKLDADLTELDYTIALPDKPMSGTLFLPRGGTPELVAAAKATPAVVVADDKKGPHGGPIQVVGKDRLEIVASRQGEVRVYVLDENLQPVAVGARTVRLGVGGSAPEVVVLTPTASGLYFVGHWKVTGEPLRITLEERNGEDVRVVVVGHKPGTALVIVTGAGAPPPVAVVVIEQFDRERDAENDDKDHGEHGEGPKINVHGGKGGKLDIKVH